MPGHEGTLDDRSSPAPSCRRRSCSIPATDEGAAPASADGVRPVQVGDLSRGPGWAHRPVEAGPRHAGRYCQRHRLPRRAAAGGTEGDYLNANRRTLRTQDPATEGVALSAPETYAFRSRRSSTFAGRPRWSAAMRYFHSADQSDPLQNRQFRRRWHEQPMTSRELAHKAAVEAGQGRHRYPGRLVVSAQPVDGEKAARR